VTSPYAVPSALCGGLVPATESRVSSSLRRLGRERAHSAKSDQLGFEQCRLTEDSLRKFYYPIFYGAMPAENTGLSISRIQYTEEFGPTKYTDHLPQLIQSAVRGNISIFVLGAQRV